MNRLSAQTARPVGETSPSSERLELPLLAEGMAQWQRRRSSVLDFGPIQPRLLEYLQPARGRLQVLDLQNEREVNQENWFKSFEQSLMSSDRRRCDWILTWDVLNYFDPASLTILNSRIDTIAAGKLRLHALIRYAKPDMPVEPDRYFVLNERQVERQTMTREQRQAPRYSPKALEKHMPSFKVDRSRLLGNGMQEFLLRYA